MQKQKWHSYSIKESLEKLKTSEKGLTKAEVATRLKEYGQNALPEEKLPSGFKVFFSQFKSPLVYILLAAGGISLVFGNVVDAVVIFSAMLIDISLGFYQENKANKSISILKKMVDFKAEVRRSGNREFVPSREVVPGDIIILQEGEKVPADARIIKSYGLRVIESALTGESVPSTKNNRIAKEETHLADRENLVYNGTTIASGKGEAVVIGTGLNTEIGKITDLIKETEEEKTPLQNQIDRLSTFITQVIFLILILVVLLGIIEDRVLFNAVEGESEGILNIAVAIAVSSIPEGLSVAITAILALGMRDILRRKALVRKLLAAETLGSTSVICIDKTGTLTQGKMKVAGIVTPDYRIFCSSSDICLIPEDLAQSHTVRKVQQVALLCNEAYLAKNGRKKNEIIGDPTEKALIVNLIQNKVDLDREQKLNKRIAEIPFSSELKYMATLNKGNSHQVNVKGAPELILGRCKFIQFGARSSKLTKTKYEAQKREFEELTEKGYRVLAFAIKQIQPQKELSDSDINDLTFVGYICLQDPIRKNVQETYKLTEKAGITSVMITGDHKLTAKSVFSEVAGRKIRDEEILEGIELDKWSDLELQENIREISVFARAEPRHKIRIVNAWKTLGEVVAMTGDGVNDAPALKAADIGIGFGSGSDVTKETADIVLLDNNYRTIVSAVERGRIIFDNIQKVVLYLMSDSFSEIVLILGALLMGFPLPILPAQILWINLVGDGLPDIALTFDEDREGVMDEKPRKKNSNIVDREMKVLIFIIGTITDVILLSVFFFLLKFTSYRIEHIQTFIFAALAVDSLFYVFSCKSLRLPIWKTNLFANKLLIYSVILSFALLVVAVYEPHMQTVLKTEALYFTDWVYIVILGFVEIFFIEITKHHYIKLKNKKKLRENVI